MSTTEYPLLAGMNEVAALSSTSANLNIFAGGPPPCRVGSAAVIADVHCRICCVKLPLQALTHQSFRLRARRNAAAAERNAVQGEREASHCGTRGEAGGRLEAALWRGGVEKVLLPHEAGRAHTDEADHGKGRLHAGLVGPPRPRADYGVKRRKSDAQAEAEGAEPCPETGRADCVRKGKQ